MIIKPSASIRQNYNDISELCRASQEPVFLTKNGEGDLVVMDIATYNRREKMLKLRENLIEAEEERLLGIKDSTISELDEYLTSVIEGIGHEYTKAI